VHRLTVVLALGAAAAIAACGDSAEERPVAEQLRGALQQTVAAADADARVTSCDGPPGGGAGAYTCPVRWPNGGNPLVFHVRVDDRGGWRTAELPSTGDPSGATPLGSVSGKGLRLP
jgi:hypothetical protein